MSLDSRPNTQFVRMLNWAALSLVLVSAPAMGVAGQPEAPLREAPPEIPRLLIPQPRALSSEEWAAIGDLIGLSPSQMAQWTRLFQVLDLEIPILLRDHLRTARQQVEDIAMMADRSGDINVDSIDIYEDAIRRRDEMVQLLSERYWSQAMQMREFMSEDRHAALESAAALARRQVYFSVIRWGHPWISRDPIAWIGEETRELGDGAAGLFTDLQGSPVFLEASSELANDAWEHLRLTSRTTVATSRQQAEIMFALNTMDDVAASAVREREAPELHRRIANFNRSTWGFAQRVNSIQQGLFDEFPDEIATALRERWEALTWPGWLVQPTNEAVDFYAELVARIEDQVEPETLEDLAALRDVAIATRSDTFRRMLNRWRQDFERSTVRGGLTGEEIRAARRLHTSEMLGLATAEIAYCDLAEDVVRLWLAEQGEPEEWDEFTIEVETRLRGLALEDYGIGWRLRARAQTAKILLEIDQPAWPDAPGTLTRGLD